MTSRPSWLKVKAGNSEGFQETLEIVRNCGIHTVCEEALCPNIGECWKNKTATFLIMGDICTRNCGFCNITPGTPRCLDQKEPEKVAYAVRSLGLKHVVITCVTRDDLEDGGASHFANVINAIHNTSKESTIEILTSDMKGNKNSIRIIAQSRPDVFSHNMEVVRRLHNIVKKYPSNYDRSLQFLRDIKEMYPKMITKTGIMVGIGENIDDLKEFFEDVVKVGVDILTIGQYMMPSPKHYPMDRYVTPEEFEEFKNIALSYGIKQVVSSPLVRSSYKAHESYKKICHLK